MSSRNVTCLISGTSYTLSPIYFKKKVEEYNGEENLHKYFVTRRVRALIERGYSASEIRNIIEVKGEDLVDANSLEINNIINHHKSKSTIALRRANASLIKLKTDPDVALFINNIKESKSYDN
jgi:hypothetical protein